MQVNFSTIRFNNAFGNRINNLNDSGPKYSESTDNSVPKFSYIGELRNDIMESGSHHFHDIKSKEREMAARIDYLVGEDSDYDDDFIEKLTY